MPPPTDLTAVELDALVGVVPPEELTMGSPRGESGNFTHNVDRVHAINYENEVLLEKIAKVHLSGNDINPDMGVRRVIAPAAVNRLASEGTINRENVTIYNRLKQIQDPVVVEARRRAGPAWDAMSLVQKQLVVDQVDKSAWRKDVVSRKLRDGTLGGSCLSPEVFRASYRKSQQYGKNIRKFKDSPKTDRPRRSEVSPFVLPRMNKELPNMWLKQPANSYRDRPAFS